MQDRLFKIKRGLVVKHLPLSPVSQPSDWTVLRQHSSGRWGCSVTITIIALTIASSSHSSDEFLFEIIPSGFPTPSRPNSWWRRRDQYSLSEARSPSRSYLPGTWIAQRTQCIHWLLEPAYDPSTSTPPISFPTLRLTRLNCPAALNEDPQSQTKATESAKHSCCWHYFYLMLLVNASYFIPFILSKTYEGSLLPFPDIAILSNTFLYYIYTTSLM